MTTCFSATRERAIKMDLNEGIARKSLVLPAKIFSATREKVGKMTFPFSATREKGFRGCICL